MKKSLSVRRARPDDAESGAEVLRRSIVSCCALDHKNRPEIIERWTANKTPELLRQWAASKGVLVVAERESKIVGVGMLGENGMLELCYVAPESLKTGVGAGLLKYLEDEARSRGQIEMELYSTETALEFYRHHGYFETGSFQGSFGLSGTHMKKRL
jgi:GNAT superfamily N-acetyltransferase